MDDLFAELERADAAARREEMLRYSWAIWGWDGPSIGGLCDIDAVIANTVDGSPLYCYMEQARLLREADNAGAEKVGTARALTAAQQQGLRIVEPIRNCATPESREAAMVVLETDAEGNPTIWCDPEIADLVRALNVGGVRTKASCSGHGEKPFGIVSLQDGRELLVLPDWETTRRAERILDAGLSAQQQGQAVAWRATSEGLRPFVSDTTFRRFSPEIQRFYEPYKCASCRDADAAIEALRAEVERSERYAEQSERERLWAEERAERLAEALRESHGEVLRLRAAMFRGYATAANGGNPTMYIEQMRDEMDKPWSGDKASAALGGEE